MEEEGIFALEEEDGNDADEDIDEEEYDVHEYYHYKKLMENAIDDLGGPNV